MGQWEGGVLPPSHAYSQNNAIFVALKLMGFRNRKLYASSIDMVRIREADIDIEFEQQQLETILQPFQRLQRCSEYEAVGMGLATVKKLIDCQHTTASNGVFASTFFTFPS